MKQRLGIADALVKAPDILILDEPTTSIDPLGVVEILDLLRALVQERQLAILLSSHLLTQVQSVCDRIGIFAAGRMVGEGTMARLASLFGDGSAAIELDIEGTDAAEIKRAEAILRGLPHVTDVTAPSGRSTTWHIAVRPATEETSVRTAILAAAVGNDLRLTSLRPVVPSLDDIYRTALHRRGLADRAIAGGKTAA
jgi:ABC-2 type transport system ATP-binding protein